MNDNELPIRNDPMMENKNIYIYICIVIDERTIKKKNDSKIKMKNKKIYIYKTCISWHILNDGRWKIPHVHF